MVSFMIVNAVETGGPYTEDMHLVSGFSIANVSAACVFGIGNFSEGMVKNPIHTHSFRKRLM